MPSFVFFWVFSDRGAAGLPAIGSGRWYRCMDLLLDSTYAMQGLDIKIDHVRIRTEQISSVVEFGGICIAQNNDLYTKPAELSWLNI